MFTCNVKLLSINLSSKLHQFGVDKSIRRNVRREVYSGHIWQYGEIDWEKRRCLEKCVMFICPSGSVFFFLQ